MKKISVQISIKQIAALTLLVAMLCAILRPYLGNETVLIIFCFYLIPLAIWMTIRLPQIAQELKQLSVNRKKSKQEIEHALAEQKQKPKTKRRF